MAVGRKVPFDIVSGNINYCEETKVSTMRPQLCKPIVPGFLDEGQAPSEVFTSRTQALCLLVWPKTSWQPEDFAYLAFCSPRRQALTHAWSNLLASPSASQKAFSEREFHTYINDRRHSPVLGHLRRMGIQWWVTFFSLQLIRRFGFGFYSSEISLRSSKMYPYNYYFEHFTKRVILMQWSFFSSIDLT